MGFAAKRNFRYYYVDAKSMFVFKDEQCVSSSNEFTNHSENELHIVEMRIINQAEGWMVTNNVVTSVFQALPYPLLLVLRCDDSIQCYTAESHKGIRKVGKNVVDKLYCTKSFNETCVNRIDKLFIKDIAAIIKDGNTTSEKYKLLRIAIYRHKRSHCDFYFRNDKYSRPMDEFLISKEELKRDIEFGHVPHEWLYKYELLQRQSFFDLQWRADVEDEWD